MNDYTWKPIEPLSQADKAVDLGALPPLYETWRASKMRLQRSSREQFAEFNQRLIRRLSVETGILEHIYDLDRGTTEALVAHGFAEDLVSHSSTNIEPSRLVDILRDQEAAIQLVIDCVAKRRDATKSLIHELHAILTRHQDTTEAVDQFGNRFSIPLLKGRYKEQPNNPKRREGGLHEYCPPLHVEAEMDNLLSWLREYTNEDPIILAAWFHHRFTQIHPYQDGNGRVARALTSVVLLRNDLLPLVVDRDLRTEYILALENADRSDLSKLAAMFARLEKVAILQALSVDADAEISRQKTLTAAVIDTLADKLVKRQARKQTELRRVNGVALALRGRARAALESSLRELEAGVGVIGRAAISVHAGGSDHDNAHWYKFEVGQTARDGGKFANFAENHYFLKASVRVNRERLVFVVSFHHVGRDLTGIMEATAFSKLESYEGSEDRESVSADFFSCSVEPFVFTYNTDPNAVAGAFAGWLDGSMAVALKEYGDRL